MTVRSISVLLCTFNRADLLYETLGELGAMRLPPDCPAEIVVVDNNSTDETAAVVARASRGSAIPIVAVTERRQGKSFALNRGFTVTRGDVIALTDDDVLVGRDWLSRIVGDFRDRDVSFVCGKVLPRWTVPPPPELLTPAAQRIWGPLALVDYGDTPFEYTPERTDQRLPIGANLAFRRDALETVGAWREDLGKVDNTLISGEDFEIFGRLRAAGLYRGFYDPRLAVRHLVPAERLTRRHFRRWFYWNGRTQALMLDSLFTELDMSRVPRMLGAPRFVYRQAARQAGRWAARLVRPDGLERFVEELRLVQFAGLLGECWRQRRRPALPTRPEAVEARR
jgi:cellulose synthase/poly-beta-1,6-N-acetylglucosamine synthase-like glycosyltransferase